MVIRDPQIILKVYARRLERVKPTHTTKKSPRSASASWLMSHRFGFESSHQKMTRGID